MHEDDASLLRKLQSDDRIERGEGERELFDRFRIPVDRILRRMLGDDSEDCLQEVFVDVFRGLSTFEGKSKLSTWIYRVALHCAWKCAAERRRLRRERDEDVMVEERAGAVDVEAELAGEELARRFAVALRRLDLEQRTVMALSALDGLCPPSMDSGRPRSPRC